MYNTPKIEPKSPEFMKKIAKLPRRRKMSISFQDIADSCKVKRSTIESAVRDKKLDPNSLTSIAYFIVKRTLNVPMD